MLAIIAERISARLWMGDLFLTIYICTRCHVDRNIVGFLFICCWGSTVWELQPWDTD